MAGAGTADADETAPQLVQQWQRTGRAMAEVRRAEVAAMSDDEALAATLDLLAALDRLPALPLRRTSGLVEQQRWFARARQA